MELSRQAGRPDQEAGRRSLVTTILFILLMVSWIGEWPMHLDTVMYSGLWRSPLVALGPLFEPVPGLSLMPWQLILLSLVPFCLSRRGHAHELDRAIFVSLACVGVTFMWGLLRGGSPYFAYYQVWRFMTALLIAYIFMSTVRDRNDLLLLGKLLVVAALLRATLCVYFYWTYLRGRFDPMPQYVTNHDDSMIFASATIILMVWAYFRNSKATWFYATAIAGFLTYAMILNDRRIVWVEIAMALPCVYVLLGPGELRSQINRLALRAAPIALLYFVVGMFSSSAIFAPVQALMSTGSDYDPSSLTRQEEARNLLHTLVVSGNPLFGTGWGIPYDKVESYWSNYSSDWILVLYTPHNSLLGLAAFSGIVGILGIWGVVPVGAYAAARGYRRATDLVSRGTAMVAIGTMAAYSVHCYGDVGLQSFQGCVLFGAALGAAGKIAAWGEATVEEPQRAAAPRRGARLVGRRIG